MTKAGQQVSPGGGASSVEEDPALRQWLEESFAKTPEESGRKLVLASLDSGPSAYGGITSTEMTALTTGLAPAFALALWRAGHRLNWELCVANNLRPWRELYAAFMHGVNVKNSVGAVDESGFVHVDEGWRSIKGALPHSLAVALSVFQAAMEMAEAKPESLMSESLLGFAERKSHHKRSLAGGRSKKALSAQRSQRIREVARVAISKHPDVNRRPISSLVGDVQEAWNEAFSQIAEPGYKAIVPELRALLPLHPKLNPKK